MTYFFTLIFLLAYFLRPFELMPEMWVNVPLLQIFGFMGLLSLSVDLMTGKAKLFRNGVDQMMVGLLAAGSLSWVANGWYGGAYKAAVDFFPSFAGYFLVAHGVNSERKWRGLIWLTVFCASLIAVDCVYQANQGVSIFGFEPILQKDALEGEDALLETLRVRWVGPFADPNDLAMLFVLIIPFLVSNLFKGFWPFTFPAFGLVSYGLYLTHSRGGLLSAVIGLSALISFRMGKLKPVLVLSAIGIFGMLALSSGRTADLSGGDASAMGRVAAWREGLAMFRSEPLFGVGKGAFIDHHSIMAHNSFIQMLAEQGFVGAFFFTGLFFLPLRSLFKIIVEPKEEGFHRDIPALGAGIIALATAMMFLSRTYVFLPYLAVALWVSLANFESEKVAASILGRSDLAKCARGVFIATLGMIFLFYMVTKILL